MPSMYINVSEANVGLSWTIQLLNAFDTVIFLAEGSFY